MEQSSEDMLRSDKSSGKSIVGRLTFHSFTK